MSCQINNHKKNSVVCQLIPISSQKQVNSPSHNFDRLTKVFADQEQIMKNVTKQELMKRISSYKELFRFLPARKLDREQNLEEAGDGASSNLEEKGWRSGESARLPPMCTGFDSRTRRNMWVEFVVGSLPCYGGFSPRTPAFPCPQKPTFSNSNSFWIIVEHFIMSLWLG